MNPKTSKRIEILIQSVLGGALIAALSFFTAVQMGAFDQSEKMAEFAQPLTGNAVVKMLTENELSYQKNTAQYNKMLARAKARGDKAFYSNVTAEN